MADVSTTGEQAFDAPLTSLSVCRCDLAILSGLKAHRAQPLHRPVHGRVHQPKHHREHVFLRRRCEPAGRAVAELLQYARAGMDTGMAPGRCRWSHSRASVVHMHPSPPLGMAIAMLSQHQTHVLSYAINNRQPIDMKL